MPRRVLILDDESGEELAALPAVTSAGAADAGRPVALGSDGQIHTSMLPAGLAAGDYVHTQATPSAAWAVPHGLGRFPQAIVHDSGGERVIAEVEDVDENNAVIHHGAAISGTARFF